MYKSFEEAVQRAEESLRVLGLPDRLPTLHKAGVHIKRHILGGSHSVVTYPPLDALQPVNAAKLMPTVSYGRSANLYIHIAYCETHCTFCHYSVGVYRGTEHSGHSERKEVEHYLKALKREMSWHGQRLRQTNTTISSIYIGGGTPLILEQKQLAELLNTIRTEFDITPDAELCIEGSPLTITAADGSDKLQFLKSAGVTRFSFGVQSFNDKVLRMAARGYRRDTAIRACETVSGIFDNWNLDLIQSLCKGGPEEIWDNLNVIHEALPPHLTYYHGRYANRPQGSWLLVRAQDFENELETLLGRMMIWQHMLGLGYQQTDGNRFVRDLHFEDPFKQSRTSIDQNLLGIGASSYSHTNRWFLRNIFDRGQYMHGIDNGQWPINRGLQITAEERLAASYVIGLRTRRLDEEPTTEHGGNHYQQLELRLRNLGLIEKFPAGPFWGQRLSRLGQLFEDEILSLFYSPEVLSALQT